MARELTKLELVAKRIVAEYDNPEDGNDLSMLIHQLGEELRKCLYGTTPNKIVVHVNGGCVQDVMASANLAGVDVSLVDDDNLKAEGLSCEEIVEAWNSATEGLTQIF